MAIEKAAVIGAGAMGGAIAAHIANAGCDVVLLDIVPEASGNRNALAEGAVARMLKDDPAPFMDKADAGRIAVGNIEDHLHLLSDADWIVEAVVERVEIKQEVYRRIDSARKTGSIVSSNTSTVLWRTLTAGMPERFARDFLIAHFFNPPRYMRLLEVAAGPATRPEASRRSPTSPTEGWERVWSRARTHPASSRTGSAPTGWSPPSAPRSRTR